MRNIAVIKAFRNEVNLSTKVKRDKTKYTRKDKHKSKNKISV